MRVRINGSTDIHTFSLYDSALGYDLIVEFLETNCLFVAEQFVYLDEEDVYTCDAEVYYKWRKIIDNQQALTARINQLKLEHGDYDVDEVINRAVFHSIEDEASAINYELDRAYGESTFDEYD